MSNPNIGRVLRPAATAEKLGIGLSSLWAKAKTDPTFPKPFKLSPRTTVFYESEVDSYLGAKAATRLAVSR